MLAVAAVLWGCASPAPPPAGVDPHGPFLARPTNPVFPGADPHVLISGGRWWFYPTTPSELGRSGTSHFHALSSPDLRSWTRSAPLIDIADIDWVDDDGAREHALWAPAVFENDGRFFLFFSVGPQNPTPSRIGVAVGASPEGPFKDSGKPLITGGNGFEAIDPMVFRDPRTGVAYLYAGGSAGSTLRVWELQPSLTEIKREIPVDQPPHFTEGPWMHHHDGVYYLSYSHGRFNRADYEAHYATSATPVGPWTYRGKLLTSDARRKGPGHHAFVRNPVSGEWIIAYHRWERPNGTGPFRGDREVAIQRVVHGPDGLIAPIRMDDAAPPASPLR